MDLGQNFVVAGGKNKNPSSFETDFPFPVRLDDGYEVALRSIAYPEICNVCNHNNLIEVFLIKSKIIDDTARIKLTIGRYDGSADLLQEIWLKLNYFIKEQEGKWGTDESSLKYYANTNKWVLQLPPNIKIVKDKHQYPNSPLNLLVLPDRGYTSISIQDYALPNKTTIVFIYSNIIEESFINGIKSRLLCVIPMVSKFGATFHEVKTLTYYPVQILEFSSILFEMRDEGGHLLSMCNDIDTTITLHMRTINTMS